MRRSRRIRRSIAACPLWLLVSLIGCASYLQQGWVMACYCFSFFSRMLQFMFVVSCTRLTAFFAAFANARDKLLGFFGASILLLIFPTWRSSVFSSLALPFPSPSVPFSSPRFMCTVLYADRNALEHVLVLLSTSSFSSFSVLFVFIISLMEFRRSGSPRSRNYVIFSPLRLLSFSLPFLLPMRVPKKKKYGSFYHIYCQAHFFQLELKPPTSYPPGARLLHAGVVT